MKKQVLALGLIFTLSIAVTNCSRDEAEQITNKTDNSLKKDFAPTIKTSNYELSNDKQTLIRWFNKETLSLDMQNDPELQNVTIIADEAFKNRSLKSIVLPNNLIKIGDYAFFSNNLTSVTIPNSVTSISENAFYDNNQLISITILAVTPPIMEKHYYKFYINSYMDNTKIYVPAQSVNAYKTAEGWKQYADKIFPIR